MSVAGGVVGYGARLIPKEEEKLEEIGHSGVTVGASPSINTKDPNDLHNNAPLDAERTLYGMIDRNEHNPHPNNAIDPQGKPLGEEEELEEGSMMGTLGTASEPDNGTYHDSDVGDWNYRDVMKRRAQRKLNRAYFPEMDYNEMTAHLREGLGMSDISMDSVDKEFFDNASGETEPIEPISMDPSEMARETIAKKGYEIKNKIGQGMNGEVFLATNKMRQNVAIKIVISDAAVREEENYRIIDSVRTSNPLIEKHFPKVYESWAINSDISIIVMEVLQPLTNDQASFVPDASFLAAKNKPWRLASAGDLYSNMRDMSQRFTLYLQNKTEEVSKNFDYFVYQLVTDWDGEFLGKTSPEYIEGLKNSVTPEELMKLNKIGYGKDKEPINMYLQNRKRAFEQILGAGSSAIHFFEILESDSPDSLGVNAAFIEIAFQLMVAGLAAGLDKNKIDGAISDFAKRQLTSARLYTQIPLSYNPHELTRGDDRHEKAHVTSKGLHAAIKALYGETGLMAKDLHDENIMARQNGDLVIVDVGLFRKNNNWSSGKNLQEMRSFRKKMLRNLRK